MTARSTVRVQLLHVPDCPLLDRLRMNLRQAMADHAISVIVDEHEGDYPSPSLLVGGIDVATGKPPAPGACCRLDLPNADVIAIALRHEVAR